MQQPGPRVCLRDGLCPGQLRLREPGSPCLTILCIQLGLRITRPLLRARCAAR